MMKCLKLIIFLLIIVIDKAVTADNYFVNTPVLNVRSCAGTNCKIIGKLTEGDSINYLQDHGEWIRIETESGSGYVIKRALSKNHTFFSIVILVFILWLAFFVYMLPAKIAANNKNAGKIYAVNLFLGWVPVIWLTLFVAALIGENRED